MRRLSVPTLSIPALPVPTLRVVALPVLASLTLLAGCGTPGAPAALHPSAALPQAQGRDMEAPFRNRPGDPAPVPSSAGNTGSPVDARSPAQGDVR